MKILDKNIKNLDEFKLHMNNVFIVLNSILAGKEVKVSGLKLFSFLDEKINGTIEWKKEPDFVHFETLNSKKIELYNRVVALNDTLKLCRMFNIKNSDKISCYSLHKMYENCDKEKLYEQWIKSEVECDTLCK